MRCLECGSGVAARWLGESAVRSAMRGKAALRRLPCGAASQARGGVCIARDAVHSACVTVDELRLQAVVCMSIVRQTGAAQHLRAEQLQHPASARSSLCAAKLPCHVRPSEGS